MCVIYSSYCYPPIHSGLPRCHRGLVFCAPGRNVWAFPNARWYSDESLHARTRAQPPPCLTHFHPYVHVTFHNVLQSGRGRFCNGPPAHIHHRTARCKRTVPAFMESSHYHALLWTPNPASTRYVTHHQFVSNAEEWQPQIKSNII